MKAKRHDREVTKCVCGHLAAHHHDLHERPYPCRLCECEDFMTKAEMHELNVAAGYDDE